MRGSARHALRLFPIRLLLLACTLSACTTETGTRVALTRANLSGIRTCGVLVKQTDDFSVRLDSDRMTGWGATVGSFVGAGIETSVRGVRDEHLAKDCQSAMGGFAAGRLLQDKLREDLEATKQFAAVMIADSNGRAALQKVNCDALLEVTITQWGLVRCAGTRADDRLQVAVNVQQKLTRLADNQSIWQRNELHSNGNCYSAEEYKSRDRLLVNELTQAIEDVAGYAVNEIRYKLKALEGGS